MPIINTIKGDLFNCGIPIIAHGCNAQGVMGSGVAKVVYDDYRWAYDTYRMMYERFQKNGRKDFLGQSLPSCHPLIDSDANVKFPNAIFNLITQDNYGRTGQRFVSYWAIASSFKLMNDQLMKLIKSADETDPVHWKKPHVAIPLIGAGLGGGDWNIIKEIINDSTPDIDITVVTL